MTWIVVRFCETDEIEVLPCNWLQDGGLALYPPYGRSKLEKAIKTREEPDTCSWKLYKITPMTKTTYNSFALASAKANKACLTSDISDKEHELPPKRPHKKKHISSDTDTDDDSESLTGLPAYPVVTSKAGSERSSLLHVMPATPSSFVETPRSSCAGTPRPLSAETPHYSHQGITSRDNGSEQFQKEVISYLVKINKILKDHATELVAIKSEIDLNSTILHSLLEKASSGLGNEGIERCDIFQKLPINDNARFEEVETALQNKESYEYFVISLARLGGINLQQYVKRFLQRILTENVMEGYSMHGHKGKRSFGKTKIFEAIVDAVQKLDKNITNKEIELKTGIFLAKCKERQKSVTKNVVEDAGRQ